MKYGAVRIGHVAYQIGVQIRSGESTVRIPECEKTNTVGSVFVHTPSCSLVFCSQPLLFVLFVHNLYCLFCFSVLTQKQCYGVNVRQLYARGGDTESGSGATPAVLRTSMEKRNMKKFAMVLIDLTNTSMLAGVPAAALFYSTGAAALAHMTRAVTQVKTSAAQRCAVHDRSCHACESH